MVLQCIGPQGDLPKALGVRLYSRVREGLLVWPGAGLYNPHLEQTAVLRAVG